MVDLVNAAARRDGARRTRIAVWGEDVADASRADVLGECKGKGGVFKVTAGLQKAYGDARLQLAARRGGHRRPRDRLGRARLKPVVEIQFFDYIWPAMQQIRDELATVRWRSGGAFRRRWSCASRSAAT
jgi:2-oxoisovalerate dehydrogenase E1 component